jgi:hypothetical protein
MFKSIITHRGIAHIDDFLSVAVLLTKFKVETIQRVENIDEEKLNNTDYIIVDIGGRYNSQRLFDHHQDLNLNCSLVLVLKDLFGYNIDFLMNIPEIKYIDLQDRYGVKKAQELMNIQNPIINLLEYSLLRWFSKEIVISYSELDFLKEIGKQFLKYLDDFKNEEKKIINSKFYKNKYGTILFNPNTTFNITILNKLLPDLIGVIHQSDRDSNLINIVQINSNPYFQPAMITKILTPVFLHKTGFLAVISREDLDKINPFDFIFEGGLI